MRYASLILLCLYTLLLNAQQIQGDWYGTLDAMGTKLPLVFHVSGTNDQLSGTMDSPSQGAFGIEMSDVFLSGNQFSCTIPAIQAKYKGTLSALGLAGDWTQAGFDFALEMDNTPPVASGKKMREQEPRDFPYERQTVTFPGGTSEVTLAGELTYPSSGKIERAVVLVSGSGGQDRNSELGEAINHRPFLVLSDFLTRQGIAVLRYDDRGISSSTGNFASATSRDFAEDASAAINFLDQHPVTKKAKIGLAGHSEGGLIGQIVASENESLDFLVLIAAPGIPIDTMMMEQSRLVQQSMGAPPQMIERNLKPLRKAYYTIRQHPNLSDDILRDSLVEVFKASIADLPEPLQRSISDKDAFARQQVGNLVNPWFRYFISYDPQPYLEQIDIPVIALNGELDMQVPATMNLDGIARGMNRPDGSSDFTMVSLPGLNHLMQTATTGSPQEYGLIEETFSPTAMRIIADWINRQ